jgi:hypothetical protein
MARVNRAPAQPFFTAMDERALICAWLNRYASELEAAAGLAPPPTAERLACECDAVRTVLWTIESGDYLTDLAGRTAH